MNTLVKSHLDLYNRVKRMHAHVYSRLSALREAVCSGTINTQADRVDLAFLTRDILNHVLDIRKETESLLHLFEQVTCAVWVQETATDLEAGSTAIKGTLARATPDVKMAATMPSAKREPEAYRSLLTDIGLPASLIDADCVRMHWPGMIEYVSQLVAAGKPLPAGIDPSKTYPQYKLTLVKHKDVDLSMVLCESINKHRGKRVEVVFRDTKQGRITGELLKAADDRIIIDAPPETYILESAELVSVEPVDDL